MDNSYFINQTKRYQYDIPKEDLDMKNTDLMTKYFLKEDGYSTRKITMAQRGNVIFCLDETNREMFTAVCSRPKKHWAIDLMTPTESLDRGFVNIPAKLKKFILNKNSEENPVSEDYLDWFNASDNQAQTYGGNLKDRKTKLLAQVMDIVGITSDQVNEQYYIRLTPKGISLKAIPNKDAEYDGIYVTNSGEIITS